MKSAKKIGFLLFSMGIAVTLNAQRYDSLILGRWVTVESVARQEIENSSLAAYMQYQFDHNNIVSYGTSQYELGHRSEYSISGNRLTMYKTTYLIESSSPDGVTLIATNHLNQYRISLIRKEVYDDTWMKHNPSLKTSPYTFTANFSLYDYVFSFAKTPDEYEQNLYLYYQNQAPPRYDEHLNVKASFDSEGNIHVFDVSGIPRLSNSNRSKIKRRIENTSGYWINHVTNHLGSDTLELNFLKRGRLTLDFRNKAFENFQRAVKYFEKEDYSEGLNSVNKAITFVDKNFQFYILRSLFYLKQDDLDKYCGDILKAHELNPLIKLSQSEIVDGEVIEIKCGMR